MPTHYIKTIPSENGINVTNITDREICNFNEKLKLPSKIHQIIKLTYKLISFQNVTSTHLPTEVMDAEHFDPLSEYTTSCDTDCKQQFDIVMNSNTYHTPDMIQSKLYR